jgi:hypothetical protein
MNASTIRVLALFSLIATLIPAGAMAQEPVHFAVPFSFTVGPKSFDAGDYFVNELSPNVLRIRSDDGRAATVVITNAGTPGKMSGMATLSFNRYGDRYFLSSVSKAGHAWALLKSVREEQLIAAKASPKQFDVIASRK